MCGATSDTAGEKFSGVNPMLFTSNLVHNNAGIGLWFDIGADNLTITFNEFTGNNFGTNWCGSSGADDEIGQPHTVNSTNLMHDNYFHDNGPGNNLGIRNSGSWDIYNNAFLETQTNPNSAAASLMYLDEGARSDVAGICGSNGGLCLVQYNRFYGNWVATNSFYAFFAEDQGTPGANWAGNHNSWGVPIGNTYYLPSSGFAFFRCQQSVTGACTTGATYTFAQWQALSFGPDAASTAVFNGGTLPAGTGPRGTFVCKSNMGTAAGSLGVCP
jgi:hypothetical protein